MPARCAGEHKVIRAGEAFAVAEAGKPLGNLGDHRYDAAAVALRRDHFPVREVAVDPQSASPEVHVPPPQHDEFPSAQTREGGDKEHHAILFAGRCAHERVDVLAALGGRHRRDGGRSEHAPNSRVGPWRDRPGRAGLVSLTRPLPREIGRS
jgi:hypothetical protein